MPQEYQADNLSITIEQMLFDKKLPGINTSWQYTKTLLNNHSI